MKEEYTVDVKINQGDLDVYCSYYEGNIQKKIETGILAETLMYCYQSSMPGYASSPVNIDVFKLKEVLGIFIEELEAPIYIKSAIANRVNKVVKDYFNIIII